MKNKLILATGLFMGLITIREVEADCPPQITGDDIDSLLKGQTISGTAGERYVLDRMQPNKKIAIKHDGVGVYAPAVWAPSYCSYMFPANALVDPNKGSALVDLKQK